MEFVQGYTGRMSVTIEDLDLLHLTWRESIEQQPAVSHSRVRPTAVSAIGTIERAAQYAFSLRRQDGGVIGMDHPAFGLETPSCSNTSRDKGTPAGASVGSA